MRVDARFLKQRSHFIVPANVERYILKSAELGADVVVLDMDDALPQDDPKQVELARRNIVEAFTTLDFGDTLRFFRPRGFERDREFEDVRFVIEGAGSDIDGLIYPKVEGTRALDGLCKILAYLENAHRLPGGSIKLGVMIESVKAVENIRDIAGFCERIVCLVFGAFDYWHSVSSPYVEFRSDHPLLDDARLRVVEAAMSAGVLPIAEMSRIYPSTKMAPDERARAEEAFRAEAEGDRDLGFWGKWVGNPAQLEIAHDVFVIPQAVVERARREIEAFEKSKESGRATLLVDGRLVDVATYEMSKKIVDLAEKELKT